MASNEIQRPYYYQGQYLGAEDFNAELVYHRDMRRRHNLAHHTWGIVTGLELVEEEKEGDTEAVDIIVRPGMAVDGYGREIIVMRPHKLDPADFLRFSDEDYYEVWLGYAEESASRVGFGYETCDPAGQFDRLRESFELFINPYEPEPDGVIVDGSLVEPPDAIVRDKSVPYQELPEEESDRWLLRLGSVRWDGKNQVFLPVEAAEHLSKGRQYVGTVQGTILAPHGKLRIADRHAASDEKDTTYATLSATLEGSLSVVKVLTADQVGIGSDDTPTTKLQIVGGTEIAADDATSGYALIGRVDRAHVVFDNLGLQARDGTDEEKPKPSILSLQSLGGGLQVHADDTDTSLFLSAEGLLGVGTQTPTHKLHVVGETPSLALDLKAGAGDTAELCFKEDDVLQARVYWSDSKTFIETDGKIDLTATGSRLGIGTDDPKNRLDVQGTGTSTGGVSGSSEVIARLHNTNTSRHTALSIDAAQGRDAVVYLAEDGSAVWDVRHDASRDQLEIRYQVGGADETKFAIDADGNVGIGTTNPRSKLHIEGGGVAALEDENSGHLMLGDIDGVNLVLDIDEVQARSNASASTLHLQQEGGALHIHGHELVSQRVIITADGDVGLGTTSPADKLDVHGRILRQGQDFSQAGSASHNALITVPWGSTSDWHIFVSPRLLGPESTDEENNALLRIECLATEENSTQWRIQARARYRTAAQQGTWFNGTANYLLVPR